jgi:hypothetical protein
MTPLEMGRLLDVVREGLGSQGEAHEVLGGVEWRGTRSGDPVLVRIVPERGRTVVRMTVRRGTSAFVGHWLPFLGVGGATGILVGALQPLDPGAVAGILAGAAAVTYGTGWPTRSSARGKDPEKPPKARDPPRGLVRPPLSPGEAGPLFDSRRGHS